MATITSRTAFKDYCLRRLGFPVIEINVDDDQIEDRIDDALQYWQDYHFDGLQKVYYIHKLTQQDVDNKYLDIDNVHSDIKNVFIKYENLLQSEFNRVNYFYYIIL